VLCDGWGVRISCGKEMHHVETHGDPSRRDGHTRILEQYLRWREGGPTAETGLEDNLKSMAAVLAAVRSAELGEWCDVPTRSAERS